MVGASTAPEELLAVDSRPHFFKILIPKYLQQLPIPQKFVRKFRRELSNVALLKGSDGKIWHVGLEETEDGDVDFSNGWSEVTEHYSLSIGYFLVFRYDGNSQFYIKVFDHTACEKEYPYTSRNDDEEEESCSDKGTCLPEKEPEDSVEILGVYHVKNRVKAVGNEHIEQAAEPQRLRRSQRIKCTQSKGKGLSEMMRENVPKSSKNRTSSESTSMDSENKTTESCGLSKEPVSQKTELHSNSSTSEPSEDEETKEDDNVMLANESVLCRSASETRSATMKALEKARQFKSNNPFFVSVMRPSYVRRSALMIIPFCFAKDHLSSRPRHVTLELSDGRHWPVGCRFKKTSSLSSGWHRFTLENNIEAGDVCIFELSQSDKITFKVIIYRADK